MSHADIKLYKQTIMNYETDGSPMEKNKTTPNLVNNENIWSNQ